MLRISLNILLLFFALSAFAPISLEEGGSAVVVLDKRVKKQFKQGYHLDIAYPEVKHLYLESTHDVNIFLQKIAWQAVANFRTRLAATHAIDNNEPQLFLSYQVYHKSSDLISIKFIQRSRLPGEQDFSYKQTTFNYDFLLNKNLSDLSDFFQQETDYATEISRLLKKEHGCKVDASQVLRYAHYCFLEQGIAISFPSSPVYGKQEFVLPWSSISKLLSSNTTVAALALH